VKDALSLIRNKFTSSFEIRKDDIMAIDYVYCLVLGGIVPSISNRPWGWLEGPGSSGKTELVLPFRDHPDCLYIGELTPNAIMSGDGPSEGTLPGKKAKPGDDPSLAKDLVGKTLICKDFSSMQANITATIKTMAHFRGSYDGDLSKHSGKAGVGGRKHRTDHGLLLVTTKLTDSVRRAIQQAGERLLTLSMFRNVPPLEFRRAMSLRALRNEPELPRIRASIKKVVWDSFEEAKKNANAVRKSFVLGSRAENVLVDLSDLVTRLRSSPTEDLARLSELGPRLIGQLRELGFVHAAFSGRNTWDDSDTALVLRAAYDSIPHSLLMVFLSVLLMTFHKDGCKPISAETVSGWTHLDIPEVYDIMSLYHELHLFSRMGQSEFYVISDQTKEQLKIAPLLTYSLNPAVREIQAKL